MASTADAALELAHHWVLSDYEGGRMEIAAALQACAESAGKKVEDLFDMINQNPGSETITRADIEAFFDKSSCAYDKDKLKRVCSTFVSGSAPAENGTKSGEKKEAISELDNLQNLAAKELQNGASDEKDAEKATVDGEVKADGKDDASAGEANNQAEGEVKADGKTDASADEANNQVVAIDATADHPITKDDFPRLVRLLYKVVKEIVLTDNLFIEKSRQIRRMDINEIMEVTAGPSLDPSIGIYRIGVRAFKDGVDGWVTVAGNAGVTFLMPCACIFRAMAACPLTAELKSSTEEGEGLKTLKEGQILELLSWSRTSRSSFGVTRIKAREQACGTVGWATTNSNDGAVFTAPA